MLKVSAGTWPKIQLVLKAKDLWSFPCKFLQTELPIGLLEFLHRLVVAIKWVSRDRKWKLPVSLIIVLETGTISFLSNTIGYVYRGQISGRDIDSVSKWEEKERIWGSPSPFGHQLFTFLPNVVFIDPVQQLPEVSSHYSIRNKNTEKDFII